MINILLKNNYPPFFKAFIDFLILSCLFYTINLIVDLPLLNKSFVSNFLFPLSAVVFLYSFKVYHSMFRYFNINDIFRLLIVYFFSTILIFLIIGKFDKFSIIYLLLYFFISCFFLLSYRVLTKVLFSNINQTSESIQNIMIFSTGDSSITIKRAFYNSKDYKIKGFIDDDRKKIGKTIDGINVFKLGAKLNKFIKKNSISKVIISADKLTSNRKIFLYKYFKRSNIQLLQLPEINQWIDGIPPNISNLKEIKIEDLLSRGVIEIDNKKNKKLYNGKSILVSGGAGSIGSEIIRKIIQFSPSEIIILDNAESPMFSLQEEFKIVPQKINIKYYIDSVCDKKVVNKIFSMHDIDIVFHAAAYKHVNMMEANPRVAVINNILGTKIIIDCSIKYKIDKFVLISSDKAVNPTNVMGASKRICELYLEAKSNNLKINTKFISTRFGNVLASNGSVVPIFEDQIKAGGPITVTHPDIERYFMTISEASLLVIEAGSMGVGGEVFLFDMGNPVKIVDLAKKMIIQKGLKVDDIKIDFTGLRPGEKLFEELLVDSENLTITYNKLIYIAKKEPVNNKLVKMIEDLIDLASNSFDNFKIVKEMKKIVPEYISNHSEFQILDINEKDNL